MVDYTLVDESDKKFGVCNEASVFRARKIMIITFLFTNTFRKVVSKIPFFRGKGYVVKM